MKRSDSITNLVAALAKAQKGIENAKRDHIAKVTPRDAGKQGYTFAYADLASVVDVVRDPLADNGLSIVQIPTVTTGENGTTVSVTAWLFHESGEFIETDPLTARIADAFPQSIGSGITYLRRYQIGPLLGVAFEADDDGNAASGNQAETSAKPKTYLPNCPNCGKHDIQKGGSVVVGKPEYGGGIVCWTNKGGCNHKWQTAEHPFVGEKAVDPALQPRTQAPRSSSSQSSSPVGDQLESQMQQSQAQHHERTAAGSNGSGQTGNGGPVGQPAANSPAKETLPQKPVPGQLGFPDEQPNVAANAPKSEPLAPAQSAAANGSGTPKPIFEQLRDTLHAIGVKDKGQANKVCKWASNGKITSLSEAQASPEVCRQMIADLSAGGWTWAAIEKELKSEQPAGVTQP